MNTSSSIIHFHLVSSVMFAFNNVTEHSLKDPLHSIPLSQLDSTYQFKQKHKPTFMCKQWNIYLVSSMMSTLASKFFINLGFGVLEFFVDPTFLPGFVSKTLEFDFISFSKRRSFILTENSRFCNCDFIWRPWISFKRVDVDPKRNGKQRQYQNETLHVAQSSLGLKLCYHTSFLSHVV